MYLPSCFNQDAFELVQPTKTLHERWYWVDSVVKISSPQRLELVHVSVMAKRVALLTAIVRIPGQDAKATLLPHAAVGFLRGITLYV